MVVAAVANALADATLVEAISVKHLRRQPMVSNDLDTSSAEEKNGLFL